MSNNADTVKIIDTRVDGAMSVPEVILETAGGNRIATHWTWEDLDNFDKEMKKKADEKRWEEMNEYKMYK